MVFLVKNWSYWNLKIFVSTHLHGYLEFSRNKSLLASICHASIWWVKSVGMSRNRWKSIKQAIHFGGNCNEETESDCQISDNISRSEEESELTRFGRIYVLNDPPKKVHLTLKLLRKKCTTVITPERDLCFDELDAKDHHRAYSRVIFRKSYKRTGVGFKFLQCAPAMDASLIWTSCIVKKRTRNVCYKSGTLPQITTPALPFVRGQLICEHVKDTEVLQFTAVYFPQWNFNEKLCCISRNTRRTCSERSEEIIFEERRLWTHFYWRSAKNNGSPIRELSWILIFLHHEKWEAGERKPSESQLESIYPSKQTCWKIWFDQ